MNIFFLVKISRLVSSTEWLDRLIANAKVATVLGTILASSIQGNRKGGRVVSKI